LAFEGRRAPTPRTNRATNNEATFAAAAAAARPALLQRMHSVGRARRSTLCAQLDGCKENVKFFLELAGLWLE
jgi:hypothetical protein